MTTVRTGRAPSPSQELQTQFAAVRLSFTWLGVRKSLTPDQKSLAAEPFGAQERYLSAAKKLLDTADPLFREVTGTRNRIISYWKGMSLPYPEPGLRLIRQDQIQAFDAHVRSLSDDLQEAVRRLDNHYDALKAAACDRLGRLFNPLDYPPSLQGLFECAWEFPSVDPPDYLRRLNPALFEQERVRMASRFDEAVRLAEDAFMGEFGKLVGHLLERIGDGKKKIFRDSAVEGLTEFFDRFKTLNLHSSGDLDALVEQAKKAVAGVVPQDLRDYASLRQKLSGQMGQVLSSLEGLMVDAPRRKLLRNASAVHKEVA